MMSSRFMVVRLLISSRARAISAITVFDLLVCVELVTIGGMTVFVILASTYAACDSVSTADGFLAKVLSHCVRDQEYDDGDLDDVVQGVRFLSSHVRVR